MKRLVLVVSLLSAAASGVVVSGKIRPLVLGIGLPQTVASPNPWPSLGYHGLTGKGVIVAILDRGIQWQHPDFINPDGTTRIKWLLDMSGQNYCASGNPAPIEYSEAQINAALAGGPSLNTLDAVGHGTVTAGIAAGNGRAAANGKYSGVAPGADLIIMKLVSEGAPAHGTQAAENAFVGCYSQALDWLSQKVDALGEPVAGLINSGVLLWGPTDGTSALSQKIDQIFANRPGRIFVSPSGDEAGLPTHAGGTYSNTPTAVNFTRSSSSSTQLAIWYTGSPLAQVTVVFDDGTTVGPLGPGQSLNANGIFAAQYNPGQEFYPATSTSGDRFVSISISGHATTARVVIQGLVPGTGTFDIYSDIDAVTSFTDHLVPGRLTDQSSTRSALVIGASVNANAWTDIDSIPRQIPGDVVGQLWSGSAGGPTRDGRMGVDIVTPGENVFAAYATNSYWSTFRFNLVQDGAGFYGRQGATSGAAPIALGAVALMLQLRPDLTSDHARALLHGTAVSDANTGSPPSNNWGFGKIDIPGALSHLLSDSVFSDDPLVARSTPIKVLHITELRARINALRLWFGLAAMTWTDPALIAGATIPKAQHVMELRTALSGAYQAAGMIPPSFADPAIQPGQTVIGAMHITELRAGVIVLEQAGQARAAK